MKRCPQCNRTYADEAITFCLADGALLSAPFDSEPAQRIPLPRSTNPPPTEILPSPTHSQPIQQKGKPKLVYATIGIMAVLIIAVAGIIVVPMLSDHQESKKTTENAIPNVAELRDNNPQTTAVIEQRADEARANGQQPKRLQNWMPLERISPNLQRAVIAGEDTNFVTHHGFDHDATQKAWDEAQREAAEEAKKEGDNDESNWTPQATTFNRGATTISQQLVKNLYFSTERSPEREAEITDYLEKEISKKRILELYLNVIEWGDGIYGAEAASQMYFHKSAENLTPHEAAFLSAMIPSPRKLLNPQLDPRRVKHRQLIIMRIMPHVQIP